MPKKQKESRPPRITLLQALQEAKDAKADSPEEKHSLNAVFIAVRREIAAYFCMAGSLSGLSAVTPEEIQDAARDAVKMADALIEELDKA